MVFNSYTFVVFFTVFFILYWFVFSRNLKLQNLFILAGSYVFYGWWDWRFLSLLIGSSLLNYLLGFYIYKTNNQKTKNLLMYVGTFAGIGSLLYFKYTNFFITSFIAAFAKFNINLNIHTISIVLPLGISFYTFRTLTYIFDIHKGKMKPTSDWVVFFSFVAFFPCLLSGPIDKAKTLIPQLEKPRELEYNEAASAMRQILWGLFKKIVIADNLAQFTNEVFDHYQSHSGSTLLTAPFYYAIQIYADFSGYSDMAIGIARLLGFKVTKNFNFPFFTQNIAEYWRAWHISLTSWLTEYVFTPLSIAFRDYGKMGIIMAIIINFALIGMWHGASWSYVLFGLLHGCYYIPLIVKGTLNKKKKINPDKRLPSLAEFANMLKTFVLVSIAFILFRSADVIGYLSKICSRSLFTVPEIISKIIIIVVIAFMAIEWLGRDQDFAIEKLGRKWPKFYRWAFYYFMAFFIFIFARSDQTFIYFQF
jgi:alginate O-acetyltransferase complex protein AlgI